MSKAQEVDHMPQSGIINWPLKLMVQRFVCMNQIQLLERISLQRMKGDENAVPKLEGTNEEKYKQIVRLKKDSRALQQQILADTIDWPKVLNDDSRLSELDKIETSIKEGVMDVKGLSDADERIRYTYYNLLLPLVDSDLAAMSVKGNLEQVSLKNVLRTVLWYFLREKCLPVYRASKNESFWTHFTTEVFGIIQEQTYYETAFDINEWYSTLRDSLNQLGKDLQGYSERISSDYFSKCESYFTIIEKNYSSQTEQAFIEEELDEAYDWDAALNRDKDYKAAKNAVDEFHRLRREAGLKDKGMGKAISLLLDTELKNREADLRMAEKKFTQKHSIRKLQKDWGEAKGKWAKSELVVKTVMTEEVQQYLGNEIGATLAKRLKGEALQKTNWVQLGLSAFDALGSVANALPGGVLLYSMTSGFLNETFAEKKKGTKDFIEDAVKKISEKIDEVKDRIDELEKHLDTRFDDLKKKLKSDFREESIRKSIKYKLDEFSALFNTKLSSLVDKYQTTGILALKGDDFETGMKFLYDFNSHLDLMIKTHFGVSLDEYLRIVPTYSLSSSKDELGITTTNGRGEEVVSKIALKDSLADVLRAAHLSFPFDYDVVSFRNDLITMQQQLHGFFKSCFDAKDALAGILASAYAQRNETDPIMNNEGHSDKYANWALMESLVVDELKYRKNGLSFQERLEEQTHKLMEFFFGKEGTVSLNHLLREGYFMLSPKHLSNKNSTLVIRSFENGGVGLGSAENEKSNWSANHFRLEPSGPGVFKLRSRAFGEGEQALGTWKLEEGAEVKTFFAGNLEYYEYDKRLTFYSDFRLKTHPDGFFSFHPVLKKSSQQELAIDVFSFGDSENAPIKIWTSKRDGKGNQYTNQQFKPVLIEPTMANMTIDLNAREVDMANKPAMKALSITKQSELTACFVPGKVIQAGVKYFGIPSNKEKALFYLQLNTVSKNLEIRKYKDDSLLWKALEQPAPENCMLHCIFQTDGNLVLYKHEWDSSQDQWGKEQTIWSTGTAGFPFAELALLEPETHEEPILEITSDRLAVWTNRYHFKYFSGKWIPSGNYQVSFGISPYLNSKGVFHVVDQKLSISTRNEYTAFTRLFMQPRRCKIDLVDRDTHLYRIRQDGKTLTVQRSVSEFKMDFNEKSDSDLQLFHLYPLKTSPGEYEVAFRPRVFRNASSNLDTYSMVIKKI